MPSNSHCGFLAIALTFTLVVAASAWPETLRAQSRAAPMRFLSADDFRGARLRGFNLDSNKLESGDLADLAASGANVARLMLPVVRCPNCTAYALQFGFDYIDLVVRLAGERGFYLVLTLNVLPPDTGSEYWTDPALKASLVSIWREIATRYRDAPQIAAWDLVNEPNPPARVGQRKVSEWRAFATLLATQIRAVDPRHAVMVALPWVFWASAPLMEPIALENVVYTFHMYEPMQVTHQGLYGYPSGRPFPSADANLAQLSRDYLSRVARFAERYGVAIFVGEFSCVRWAPQDTADRYVSAMIGAFEAQGWSWSYHAFRGFPGWNAELAAAPKEALMEQGRLRALSGGTEAWKTLSSHFAKNRPL